MTISIQNTILNSIKTTLGLITIANEYQTNIAKVMRGIRDLKDFSGNMPGLTIWKEKSFPDGDYQGGGKRVLKLHVWGFCNVDARHDDYDNLDKLEADVVKVLCSKDHNPLYYNDVFIKDIDSFEGGTDNSHGILDMVVEIEYFHKFGEI